MKVLIIAIGGAAILGVIFIMGMKMFKEINEEQQFSLEGIDEIQVTMSSTPIHIIRTETGNQVRFHYYGKALQEITLDSEISNKTLSVNSKRKYVLFGTGEVTLLDVYLPGKYTQNIAIKTSSGVVMMDSFIFADFTLHTSSGGLEVESLQAGKTSLSTTSGKLNIKKLRSDELEIKGTSSSINIGECMVQEAKIKVTSGNITVENSVGNFDVQSTSGRVLLTCLEFVDRNIVIETTSGSITLGLPGIAEFLIEAEMTSGKFQSDFPIDSAGNPDKRKVSAQIGTASNKVSIHTKSGQIKVLKMIE
jgi:lia operon protein LiaG